LTPRGARQLFHELNDADRLDVFAE